MKANHSTDTPATGRTHGEDASIQLWVERAQDGDREAFAELYRHSLSRVYALCLRLTGNRNEADELTQEAFVRAWRKLGSFRGDSAFSSWMHRLTTNVVLERWRSEGRRRARVVSIAEAPPVEPHGSSASPRLAVDLERAIAGLPTGARTVFVLHDVEGYRHREIAQRTGLAEGTCKAQLHRARKLLRERLQR